MRFFSQFSLRIKILLALLLSAGVLIVASVFGAWQLKNMEDQIRQVNNQYIPLLKALSQLDSHQYLLGKELGRAIELGQARPESLHVKMMESKLSSLRRLFSSGSRASSVIEPKLRHLESSFRSFLARTDEVFSYPLDQRVRENFSRSKLQFESDLKESVRFLDKEVRNRSLGVEHDISRSISLVAGLLATFLLLAAGVVIWIDRLLEPLLKLTDVVKTISARGLKRNDIALLSTIQRSEDEIGIFAEEFTRMSRSVFQRTHELIIERKNLHRAQKTLKNQNETLRKTRAKLIHQEKLGLVGKLSAQMAHEIRNPLNALSLHLENLEFEIEDPPQVFLDSVDCMKKEIFRLNAVSSSYLNLAKSPKLNFEKISLRELLHDAFEVYAPLLKENNIRFLLRIKGEHWVIGDRNNLSLVVGNLIKNACGAFSESKGGDSLLGAKKIEKRRWLMLSVKEESESNMIRIELSDNGPGVSKEYMDSMFTPFFTTKAAGTGLGLSHSKQIVDAHGGEISFRNRRDGLTFIIQLPKDGNLNV